MNWGEKRYNTFYKETVHFGDDRVVRFIKKNMQWQIQKDGLLRERIAALYELARYLALQKST